MARLMQAGEGFVTDGERRAATELQQLPAGWTVIANKTLATSHGRSYEIDFIVVTGRNVFAIDEKGWRGRIHGSDQIWVRDNGSSERSPLGKIDYVAKVLHGHLAAKVAGFRDIAVHTVTGFVLLSGTDIRPSVRDPRAAKQILLLTAAQAALERLDAESGDPVVGSLAPKIVNALMDLSDRPKLPQRIDDYEITDVTTGPTGAYIFRAKHPLAGERQLTLYQIDPNDPKARDFYLHEYHALAALEHSGAVPEVLDPFFWSEDFLVVPSRLPMGRPLSSLAPPDSREDVQRELEHAAASFESLAQIHAAGVLHRAIGPEVVYIGDEHGSVRTTFTGFFAARQGDQTIALELDQLKREDPYAAPELALGYGYATEESDAYSLALIWLERLSGLPVASLIQPDGVIRIPSQEEGWPFLPADVTSQLLTFFRQTITRGPLAQPGTPEAGRLTATECVNRLKNIAQDLRTDTVVEGGELLDDRYKVIRVLGTGASARTFLAEDSLAPGLFALKQFLHPAAMEETREAQREFTALRNFPHPHLPRVYDIYPPSHQVHVKLEYVDGFNLTEQLSTYGGDVERCRVLADDLLDAVEHLEKHRLLHRDIKPDNVIIRDGSGEAVLIDFGAATPAGVPASTAGTAGFLPPEALFAASPPPSSDRYALAVLLFRALSGREPFEDPGSLDHLPLRDLSFLPEDARHFATALLLAVAQEPEQRYTSAREFRAALLGERVEEDERLEARINPWVDALRSLFRNSRHGNADNRGLDSQFARDTYVPTALDDRLLPAILERHPRAVFLSGNPGDGKTAFLEQVQTTLQRLGGTAVDGDASGWEWQLDLHTYRACYDASEAHDDRSADEQLLRRLDGLQGDVPARADLTVLVAINDGRLEDVQNRFGQEFSWLAAALEQARDSATLDDSGVWVIDLKQRSYVTLRPDAGEWSVMRRVLGSLVEAEHWGVCTDCSARSTCPLRLNALTLGASGEEEHARRLEEALALAHLRRLRHLTMRDLRSGLAYLITGDRSCEDVHAAASGSGVPPTRPYWHLAFTTEPEQDVLLGQLRPLDPARLPKPALERFFHFRRAVSEAQQRASLFLDGRDLAPSGEGAAETIEWLEDVKRRFYFEARSSAGSDLPMDWRALLPYRFGTDFRAVLAGDRPPGEFLPDLVRGIGRSDGISGSVLEYGLCLKVAHSEANRLTVLKQFPLEQFTLEVMAPPATELVEAFPEVLRLRHLASGARLLITLDLFELLLRLADGLEPDSAELRPLIEDLVPFKSRVQLSNTRDLVLVENRRQLYQLRQREGIVQLLDFASSQEVTA